MTDKKLHLILCWHMHQPDYRNLTTGEFMLPWTYLHAMKDYTDMAYHLESHPKARAVFNFVPVLLDQLEDYSRQFEEGRLLDPLLRLLAEDDLDGLSPERRALIFDSCFRTNHTKMIEPYPAYKRLWELFNHQEPFGAAGLDYLSGQYLADLLVWYHLVWCGETVRRNHELVVNLMTKGTHFTAADRRDLLALIGRLIRELIPRYRKLADDGQIEISTTPHCHPIVPLLIDFKVARECMPGVSLPEAAYYPGGLKRASFHINSAIDSHRERFGVAPQGIWPAEGGVSQAAALVFAEHGCRWMASGETVLVNSLRGLDGSKPLPDRMDYLYRPYRIATGEREIVSFFRDDRLSDRIGFEYAKWFGKDAVDNFIHALEEIWRCTPAGENPVVSVIMDGENAWEYYPYNGYYFLSEMYEALESHPFIRTTTFKDHLDGHAGQNGMQAQLPLELAGIAGTDPIAAELPYLVAGSWVYGTFSTWIGSPDKNRAWDLLCAAKQSFDLVVASGRLSEEEIERAHLQLADCEGSDWFWWFGDYNPQHSVESFDKLYRENLANLYGLLKLPAPEELGKPISHGGGNPEAGGAMRRA
ncbi:MAG: glycoside hydrolase family 57 protein, partial [Sulfuricella sp.]|nr:glycoside hydrolase family 57 protein [Sulfuricella sp.]